MSTSSHDTHGAGEVRWLDQLPVGWSMGRLSSIIEVAQTGPFGSQLGSDDYVEGGVPVVNPSNITGGRLVADPSVSVPQEIADRLSIHKLAPDDLIFGRRGEMGRCAVANSANEGWLCGTGCIRARLDRTKAAPKFVAYCVETPGARAWLSLTSVGATMENLNTSILRSLPLPIPSLAEQIAIADFLDREMAKIDALVEQQQRLMALLAERITSLALPSLSTGQRMQLRRAAQQMSRPVTQEEGQTYVPLGLYNRGRGLFHKDPREKADMGESDFFWVENGDLIVSGQFAWEGAVAMAGPSETGCVVSHRYPIIQGIPGVAQTEYLFALLTSSHGNFLLNEHSRGAAGRNRPLNIGTLLKEEIPIASSNTQHAVLSAVTKRAELVIAIGRQTQLLQERRGALISAAVTGKIDVRSIATPSAKAEAA